MATIRVFRHEWEDETNKPTYAQTDYPDGYIKTDDGVLIISQRGIPVAAYNRWDRAITVDPKAEQSEREALEKAFDDHAKDVEKDYGVIGIMTDEQAQATADAMKLNDVLAGDAPKLAEKANRPPRHTPWRSSSVAS